MCERKWESFRGLEQPAGTLCVWSPVMERGRKDGQEQSSMATEEFLSQSWPPEELCVSQEDTCLRALQHSVPSWEQTLGNVPTGHAHSGFHSSSSSSRSIMLPPSPSRCWMPARHMLSHGHYPPYFTGEETGTQRSSMTQLRPRGARVVGPGLK